MTADQAGSTPAAASNEAGHRASSARASSLDSTPVPASSSDGSPAGTLLAGRHALVTGGARGIGASIVRALLAQGATVTIAGRHADALTAAVESLQAGATPLTGGQRAVGQGAVGDPPRIGHVVVDVSDADSVRAAFGQAQQRAGVIDILVNNAGQAASAPLGRTDDALWRQMLDVNLSGSFFCMRAVLPGMVDAGWGRIVNIASTAGLIGYGYTAAYCASKHGVIGLTRATALEVATKGVTVNAVCPGFTETDLLADAVDNIVAKTGRDAAQVQRDLASLNPQKRLVRPDEVANAVLWLCLPGSDAMNGQSLAVAGGEVM